MIPSRTTRVDLTTTLPRVSEVPHFQPHDDYALASALRLSVGALWYFVLNNHLLYEKHAIPKKSGGTRVLHVPDERLARAQRKVLTTFLNRVEYPEHVSAYVPGRNTLDAAEQHAGRPILIVVDLKDFFPSTKRSWVRDALMRYLEIERQPAELLAALCCTSWRPGEKGHFIVPQGAPTSGAVANLVAMDRLDPLIFNVCATYSMTYTRYADDLAFSREAPMSSEEVSAFIGEILQAVKTSGYRTNYKKIRALRPNKQQRLLGMTLNVRPNLPKKTYKHLRAVVHCCATEGYEIAAKRNGFANHKELAQYLNGWLAYGSKLAPAKIAALRERLPDLGAVLDAP